MRVDFRDFDSYMKKEFDGTKIGYAKYDDLSMKDKRKLWVICTAN